MRTAETFWAELERSGDCLLWTGYVNVKGYGNSHYEGKPWLAHRLAFFLATGDTPDLVMHSCDVPACCEPSHLSAGTAAENTADMMDKGRCYWLKQTHCKNGHSFDEHGRIAVRKSGHKYRACRQCGREATARFKGKV